MSERLISRGTAALIVGLITLGSPAFAQTGAVGEWELEVEWPQRSVSVLLTVQTEDGLAVTWTGPQGRLCGRDVALTDGLLTFVLVVEDQNERNVELRFAGRATAETITGTLLMPNRRELNVAGRRRSR